MLRTKGRIPKNKEAETSKQRLESRDLEACIAKVEFFQVVIKSRMWWSLCGAAVQ